MSIQLVLKTGNYGTPVTILALESMTLIGLIIYHGRTLMLPFLPLSLRLKLAEYPLGHSQYFCDFPGLQGSKFSGIWNC